MSDSEAKSLTEDTKMTNQTKLLFSKKRQEAGVRVNQIFEEVNSFRRHCKTLGTVVLRECVYPNDPDLEGEDAVISFLAEDEFDSIIRAFVRLINDFKITNIKQLYNRDCYTDSMAEMICRVTRINFDDWFNVILDFDHDFISELFDDVVSEFKA